jgi:heptose-I-phosphate ethanolaminephosphotransferase
MNASTNDNRFLSALRAFVRPVVQEWPLWLTMLLTLVPLSWQSLEYHWRWFHELPAGVFVGMLCNMSVVAVVAILVVWLVTKLPCRRFFKTLIYVLLFAQWVVALFLMRNFHTSYTPEVLKLLAETNRGESSEFLRTWIGAPGTIRALMIAGFTLLCMLIAEAKRRSVASFLSHPAPTVLTAVTLAALLLQGLWLGHKLVMPYHSLYDLEIAEARYHSNDVFSTLHSSLLTLKFQRQETRQAIDLAVKAATTGQATCEADSLEMVLIIGESYNKWHSSLYGYPLDTSPLMAAERDQGLLTVFTDAIAPYNLTSVTIQNMLSLNSIGYGEKWHERPMWPAVMRRAGWQIDLWDNQRDFMVGETFAASLNSFLFAPEIVQNVYHAVNDTVCEFDGDLAEQYYNQWNPAARRLVIFHLMGQHTDYGSRYPHTSDWEAWKLEDVPAATAPYIDARRRGIMLDYARATRYNDAVLASIISHYRDRDAVVVMLSDHGEEVFDYRDFMERDHNPDKTAQMVRYENGIPLLVWCSPVYKQRHPDRADAIARAAGRPFMSDGLGQMMLWLGMVNSPWNDSTRNVLHPAYRPARRLIYDGLDYDHLVTQDP